MKQGCLRTGNEKGTWFSHCQHLLANTLLYQHRRGCSQDSPGELRGAILTPPLSREEEKRARPCRNSSLLWFQPSLIELKIPLKEDTSSAASVQVPVEDC